MDSPGSIFVLKCSGVGDQLIQMAASFTSSQDGCSVRMASKLEELTLKKGVALLVGDSAGKIRVRYGTPAYKAQMRMKNLSNGFG